MLNHAGVRKEIFGLEGKTLSWVSDYRSVTFNHFGKEFPLGGINQNGLVVEELNCPDYGFSSDPSRFLSNEFQFVQYLLDKCSNVEEVCQKINGIQIKPLLVALHYFVADRHGNIAVIEPRKDGFICYSGSDLPLKVLSNNNYLESIRYTRNFAGFGGDLPVQTERKGSNDRFVSVSSLIKEAPNKCSVDFALALLDTVSQEDTRWSIVYDIVGMKIYLKFYNCCDLKTFELDGLFSDSYPDTTIGCRLEDCFCIRSDDFKIITTKENKNLMNEVISLFRSKAMLEEKHHLMRAMILFGNKFLPTSTGNNDR
ncbi:MAG: linear amide C-N hydrolase [Bacteroidales bacterium]|nr:linear amide C-N hydrolase [Bacteroidales bacterium]MCF8351852.1 linear amide C-N hydrolase [Bacteroidales bacterium]MCF8375271.1 linear amide C-N hydrolase [Bacteroidales bacterium]MCF8401255.1 linear amide C-N hydrolase [Bacteroidales bacterium]